MLIKKSCHILRSKEPTNVPNPCFQGGLGGYPGAVRSSSNFWRGGSTSGSSSSSFKPTIPLAAGGASTAFGTAPPSTNSSLYAAVMAAAAVASWGGQSISTATSAANSLATGTNTAAPTALRKSHVDANIMARKNKPLDSAKNPYSPRCVFILVSGSFFFVEHFSRINIASIFFLFPSDPSQS